MKKKIIAAVLVSSFVVAGAASANWGRGGGMRGYNYPDCPQYPAAAAQQVDPAVQEKVEKFFTDTQELRKEIAMKQAEKMALLRNDAPDPATVSKLTGELFDLRNAMREKAAAAGVDEYLGPRGPRGGYGMSNGKMHHQKGFARGRNF